MQASKQIRSTEGLDPRYAAQLLDTLGELRRQQFIVAAYLELRYLTPSLTDTGNACLSYCLALDSKGIIKCSTTGGWQSKASPQYVAASSATEKTGDIAARFK
jgi:hypothetical protein